jgi:hypothetical protein
MVSIPRALRHQVIERAKGLCEYCQTAQAIVIEMEVDHVLPQSVGGLTTEANLCLACATCNRFKSNHQTEIDPETGQPAALFNPRTQTWSEHFAWSADGTHLIGRTPAGRATIERLKINRDIVVRARALWVQAGWHPPKT